MKSNTNKTTIYLYIKHNENKIAKIHKLNRLEHNKKINKQHRRNTPIKQIESIANKHHLHNTQ